MKMPSRVAHFFLLIFFFLLITTGKSFNQDSVQTMLAKLNSDTDKMRALSYFTENESDEKIWPLYNEQLIQLCLKKLSSVGSTEKRQLLKYISDGYNNKGVLNEGHSQITVALYWYSKSYKIKKAINDSKGLSFLTYNMGVISQKQKLLADAENYFHEAIRTSKEIGELNLYAQSLKSLASVYVLMGKDSLSLPLFLEAKKTSDLLTDSRLKLDILNSLSVYYSARKDFANAMKYNAEFLKEAQSKNDSFMIYMAYFNYSISLYKSKRCAEALSQIEAAKPYDKFMKDYSYKMNYYLSASNIYICLGNFKEALRFNQKYYAAKDSLVNLNNQQSAITLKFERKQLADSLSNQEEKKLTEVKFNHRTKQQRLYIVFAIAGLIFLGILALILYRSNVARRKTNELIQRQKQEVENQKGIVEYKNKQITDSINYSQRIQNSILPGEDFIHKMLPQSFVLFKPKDIVSGDFYWVEKSKQNPELVFFAAVDCTGHGVPGALLSMLGFNILNQAIVEHSLEQPGEILQFLNVELKNTLGKNSGNEAIKDGMDISLCMLNTATKELNYAGAFNPLYIVRNGILHETKADKIAIGASLQEEKGTFTTHTFPLQKDDCIYIFTDGYADQFGGERGKKFKYASLKKVLCQIHNQPTSAQKQALETTFHNWKGNLEQVDDVLLIGVKIS